VKVQIQIPPKLISVFSGSARHRGAYGGRGSAKTRTFALMTAVRAYMFAEAGQSGVILCSREHLNSLEESSMEEVKQAIKSVPWLADYFDIGEKYIRTKNRRVWYVFAGLRSNLDSIKSKARILINWTDEAENVSNIAWQKLLPTIREEGSENWVTWNPEKDGSPTDERFRKHLPSDSKIVEINWQDNPWFPAVLDQQRLDDMRLMDVATYQWIWEGAYLKNSAAQVLNGKTRVADFEPGADWNGPYYGVDFGFSQDPTTGVKCWVYDRRLWIEYEAGKVGLELDDTGPYLTARVPGIDGHTSRADSARPESISYLKRNGLPRITGVSKWPGSVEDGITHLRSYEEIVIHTRCTGTAKEAADYSYKVDRLTGDVMPVIVDAHNHYWDAVRYAIDPIIKSKGKIAPVSFSFYGG